MTTEKQTPEALAAELLEAVTWTMQDPESSDGITVCFPIELCHALRHYLASAQAQQEPIGTQDSLAEELHQVLTDPDSSLSDGARRSVDFVIHALRLRPLYAAPATAEQPAEPNREPNNEEVICPACTHQFRAIPVQVQRLLLDAGIEPPFLAAPASAPAAREITDAEIDGLISMHPDLVQAIHFDLLPAGALVGLVRAAIALANGRG